MPVNWNKFNYEEEVKINLDSLEMDNKDQSELIMKYGREKTRINKEIALQKENIAVLRAKITKKLAKESGKKPTVAEVDTECALDSVHKEGVEYLIELEHDSNLLTAAIKSFESRGYSLQEERSLLGMGYWSGTSKTNGVRKIQQAQADDKTRTAVNNKRRSRRQR